MTTPARDVGAIYSSYNLEKYQYMEVKQNESYIQAKQKWLIFHSETTDYTDVNIFTNKEVKVLVESA